MWKYENDKIICFLDVLVYIDFNMIEMLYVIEELK